MTPAFRLSISLVASLLLWLPTVPGSIASKEDPARIALGYLLALVVSRIGVGLVFRVFNAYAAVHEAARLAEEAEKAAAEAEDIPAPDFNRRREDALDEQELDDQALLDEALDEVEQTTALAS